MLTYLKLFRFNNLLLVAGAQYIMRWCIINPILKINNFQEITALINLQRLKLFMREQKIKTA